MKGYKVVNYNKWSSLPDIFPNIKLAKEARDKWEYADGSIIEFFNSRSRKAKVLRG